MSIHKSGVYGANIPEWTEEHWRLVEMARFSHALVRSDTSPEMAHMCRERGMEVVVQLPDHFNLWEPSMPSAYATESLDCLDPFKPYSSWVVLDNEPNLTTARAGNWWAEEFTRWFRAVIACFRYYDKDCHWRLIMPAMCGRPGRNEMYWFHVNRENYLDCDASSAHCFWAEWWQVDDPHFGAQHQLVHQLYPTKPLYILEYANSSPLPHTIDKTQEYRGFVHDLPCWVVAAMVFILGGTTDWQTFHLTMEQAAALGSL